MCHGPATLEKELRNKEPGEALQEGLPLGSGAGFKLRSYLWSLPEQCWTACAWSCSSLILARWLLSWLWACLITTCLAGNCQAAGWPWLPSHALLFFSWCCGTASSMPCCHRYLLAYLPLQSNFLSQLPDTSFRWISKYSLYSETVLNS